MPQSLPMPRPPLAFLPFLVSLFERDSRACGLLVYVKALFLPPLAPLKLPQADPHGLWSSHPRGLTSVSSYSTAHPHALKVGAMTHTPFGFPHIWPTPPCLRHVVFDLPASLPHPAPTPLLGWLLNLSTVPPSQCCCCHCSGGRSPRQHCCFCTSSFAEWSFWNTG